MIVGRIALVLFLATYPAFADDPRASQIEYQWTKFCMGKTGGGARCSVSVYARPACYPAGGRILISDNLTITLFTRHIPKTGAIVFQLDDTLPVNISASCTGFACTGQLAIDSEFVEKLRRSQMLTVHAVNSANRDISISIPLSNLAAVYDGPALSALYLPGARFDDNDLARQAALNGLPVCDE